MAAERCHIKVVKLLLNNGAKVAVVDDVSQNVSIACTVPVLHCTVLCFTIVIIIMCFCYFILAIFDIDNDNLLFIAVTSYYRRYYLDCFLFIMIIITFITIL